jgi:hypothetical protein
MPTTHPELFERQLRRLIEPARELVGEKHAVTNDFLVK